MQSYVHPECEFVIFSIPEEHGTFHVGEFWRDCPRTEVFWRPQMTPDIVAEACEIGDAEISSYFCLCDARVWSRFALAFKTRKCQSSEMRGHQLLNSHL